MRQKKSKFLSVFLALAICAGSSLYQPQVARAQETFVHPEAVRTALRELATTLNKLAPAGSDVANRVSQLEQELDQLTFEELNVLARAFDGPRLLAAVENLKSAVAAQEQSFLATQGAIAPQAALATALSPPNYESACLPPRTPSASVLLGLLLVLEITEEAANVANFFCETVLVGAGFGGNVPGSCVAAGVAEALAIGERTLLAVFEACFDSIDSAEIEAAWKNTVVIHGDLATHDGNLATHDNNLATHDTDIKNRIAVHDADIKVRLTKIEGVLSEIINLLLTPQGRRPGFPKKP